MIESDSLLAVNSLSPYGYDYSELGILSSYFFNSGDSSSSYYIFRYMYVENNSIFLLILLYFMMYRWNELDIFLVCRMLF